MEQNNSGYYRAGKLSIRKEPYKRYIRVERRFGEEYSMEIMIDNEWHTIIANQAFTEPLYSIKKDSKKEIELNWKDVFGELEPGKYRIVKRFSINLLESFNRYIACEFTIK